MGPPNTKSVPKIRPFSDQTNIIKIHSVLHFQPKRSTKKYAKECKENQPVSTTLISTRSKVKKATLSSQFKSKQDLSTILSDNNKPWKQLLVIIPRLDVASIINNHNVQRAASSLNNKPWKQLQVIIPRLDIASVINNHSVQREASSLVGTNTAKNTTNSKPHRTHLELCNTENTVDVLSYTREFKMLRTKNVKERKARKHGTNPENSSKLVPYKKSDLELDNRISSQISDLPQENIKEPNNASNESHKLLTVLLERIGEDAEKNDLKGNQALAESKVGPRFYNKKKHPKKQIMDNYLVNTDLLRSNLKKSSLQNIKKNKALPSSLPKGQEKEKVILENVRDIIKLNTLERETSKSETSEIVFQSNIKTFKNNKNLRKRYQKNYAEETLTSTLNSSIPNEAKKIAESRVPVYRQIIEDKKKEEKDLYEFDESSSDEKKPQKTKKKRKSSMFDKTTHDILQKIQNKEEKSKKKRAKKPKNYAATINNIVKKVMKKVEKKGGIKEVSNSEEIGNNKNMDLVKKKVKINEENQTEHAVVLKTLPVNKNLSSRPLVWKNLDEIELCDSINHENDYELESVQDEDDNLLGFYVPSPAPSPVKINPRIHILNDITLNASNVLASPSQFHAKRPNAIQNVHDNIDNHFGFDVPSPAPSPVKINPRIHILNDITLNTSNVLASPSQFHSKRPNANSTFVQIEPRPSTSRLEEQQGEMNNTLTGVNNVSTSPWRFNLGQMRRNPHFLNLKNSGLPCLDQDMVLDHTHVENIEQRCSKTPRRLTEDKTSKSPKQTSILDFVESSVQDKENIRSQSSHTSSLYDYEDFDSPVKTRSSKIITQKVQLVKRKVLATITESNVPVEDSHLDMLNESIEIQMDYFGFEDSFEAEDKDKSASAKPSRIDVNLLKKYPSKKGTGKDKHVTIVEPVEELASEPIEAIEEAHSEVDSNEVNEAAHTVVDDNEIKLFEDPEELLDQVLVSPKLKQRKGRRKRLNSCSSDVSDYEKPKRKRKDAKTRAEEAEFEEWASKFNSMCKEVEEHELEIE